ncbi:MAG: PstS family phosphate ABC transporter substrate-binding protein [Planctomycetota bacterium]
MRSSLCVQPLRRPSLALAGALAASCLVLADDREPPAENPLAELATLEYRPAAPVEGSLKLSGSSTLEKAAAFWAEGFMRVHPAATVTLDRTSTDTGWRDLAAGKADVALLSRPMSAAELAAVTAAGRKPIVIAAAFEPLVWIVHESNPVTALPWSPETGILPGPRPSTGDGPPRWGRWLDAADWGDLAVTVHGPGKGSGSRWHLEKLLGGQAGWRGTISDADSISAVAEAVAKDRGGLGLVGAAAAARDGIRAVPLALPANATPPEDAVPGSERSPDERPLFIAVIVPTEGDWPAATREFVAYVLSYPGQLDVAKDGLGPLTRGEIFAQQERLGRPVQR